MNKRIIWLIIGLMSIAMLGLASIQVYWIRSSVKLQERKFNISVRNSLDQIAKILDKEIEPDKRRPLLRNNYNNSNFSINLDTLRFATEADNRESQEIMALMRKISAIDYIERLDPKRIKAIIRQVLNSKGISIPFDYGIFSAKDSTFEIINENYVVNDFNKNYSTTGINENNLLQSPFSRLVFEENYKSSTYLKLFFSNENAYIYSGNVWWILISSIFFSGLVLFCFAYTVFVIFQQKKVSEMKTDFINNMTHEFKTPIATISLAADSITSPMIVSDKNKVGRFAGIIKQENKRMLSQVEKVLQMALIDKSDFNLKLADIDLHHIISQAVEYIKLQVVQRDGSVSTNLSAENAIVEGDQTHISNIINNLLDNANKYSPDKPNISVSTRNLPNGVEVIVKDNGIGMNKEAKKHIFDKFYRVHTGNLHDVKGFGLGLSYVKAMITAHKGQIDVKSELGEGSSFILFFPFRHSM